MNRLALFFLVFLGIVFSSQTAPIEKLEERLNAYPSNLKLRYVLSRAYAQKGSENPKYYDKSIQQLQEIMEVKQIPVVKFYLGLVHARKGDLDTAIYHWRTIVRSMKPNNLTTLRYLALAFEKKGKHQEALSYWQKILAINPEDYKAHYHSALVTLKDLSMKPELRYSWAIQSFNKVLGRYPDHRKTLWYLSLTYKKSSQFLKQRKTLNRLLEISPSDPRLRKELEDNQIALRNQPQDAVLEVSVSRPVVQDSSPVVSNEITDRDFETAFKQDPEPEEVPVEPIPVAVEKEANLPLGGGISADAELLFNQGITYMQNGEYDLALFNFLQAQELDPKFAQCYLQIGEVYFKLADSTPTEEKFKEHLNLAAQALTTAVQLVPDSLLEHAAKARQSEVDLKLKQGFVAAHMEVAKKALQNQDLRFAAEEYLILLNNGALNMDLALAVASILPKIDEGLKLDLNNSIQIMISESRPEALYLGFKMLEKSDRVQSIGIMEKLLEASEPVKPLLAKLKEISESPVGADFSDHVLLGRYLQKSRVPGASASHYEKALSLTADEHWKKSLESWISEVRSSGVKPTKFEVISSGIEIQAKKVNRFDKEKQELLALSSEIKDLFSGYPQNQPQLENYKSFLNNFLEGSVARTSENENLLALWMQAKILQGSSVEAERERGEQAILEILSKAKEDHHWHFYMGLLCLRLSDFVSASRFFENARLYLLGRGFEVYNPYAEELSLQAKGFSQNGKLEIASEMIKSAFLFNPLSVEASLAKIEVLDFSSSGGGFSWSFEFFSRLLLEEFFFEIFKSDLGTVLFYTVFLFLLVLSLVIVLRNHEELTHLIQEFIGEKALSIPVVSLISGALLLIFPTGLLLFIPLILWGYMKDFEQIIYICALLVLILIPFLFPTGYSNNQENLRALWYFSTGDMQKGYQVYKNRLRDNPMDLDARFQMGLYAMLEDGNLTRAEQLFRSVLEDRSDFIPAIGNLAVIAARKGDMDAALKRLSDANTINPVHDKVLYNLAKIHELKGEIKSASKYLGWIGGGGEKSRKIIDGYLSFSAKNPRLFATFYLESRIKGHDTWFAPVYESKFTMSLILFVVWFFMGGGLVALLLFLKDKMSVELRRCGRCDQVVCSNCQSVLAGEEVCSFCFEDEKRRHRPKKSFIDERNEKKARIARQAGVFFPGFFQIVKEKYTIGVLLTCLFFFFLLMSFATPGFLFSQIVPYSGGIILVSRILFLILALLIWISSQILSRV